MQFNPLFLNETGNTKTLVSKSNKMQNNKYLFSDIVKVVMKDEEGNNKLKNISIDEEAFEDNNLLEITNLETIEIDSKIITDSENEIIKLELADILPPDMAELLIDENATISNENAISFIGKEQLEGELKNFITKLVSEEVIASNVNNDSGLLLRLEDQKSAVNIEITKELSKTQSLDKIVVQALVVPEKSKIQSLTNLSSFGNVKRALKTSSSKNGSILLNSNSKSDLQNLTEIQENKSSLGSNVTELISPEETTAKPMLRVFSYRVENESELSKTPSKLIAQNKNNLNIVKGVIPSGQEALINSIKNSSDNEEVNVQSKSASESSEKKYNISQITIVKKQNPLLKGVKNTSPIVDKNLEVVLPKVNLGIISKTQIKDVKPKNISPIINDKIQETKPELKNADERLVNETVKIETKDYKKGFITKVQNLVSQKETKEEITSLKNNEDISIKNGRNLKTAIVSNEIERKILKTESKSYTQTNKEISQKEDSLFKNNEEKINTKNEVNLKVKTLSNEIKILDIKVKDYKVTNKEIKQSEDALLKTNEEKVNIKDETNSKVETIKSELKNENNKLNILYKKAVSKKEITKNDANVKEKNIELPKEAINEGNVPLSKSNKKVSVKVRRGLKFTNIKTEQEKTPTNPLSSQNSNEFEANSDLNNSSHQTQNGLVVENGYEAKNKSIHSFHHKLNSELLSTKEDTHIQTQEVRQQNSERIIKSIEVIKEITRFISKQEKGSLSFKISPEHLGNLKITLETTEHNLTANIQVENEQAKHLVEKNINILQNQLKESGVELGSLNISLGNPKSNKQEQHEQGNGKSEFMENINIDENITEQENRSLGYNTYEYLA